MGKTRSKCYRVLVGSVFIAVLLSLWGNSPEIDLVNRHLQRIVDELVKMKSVEHIQTGIKSILNQILRADDAHIVAASALYYCVMNLLKAIIFALVAFSYSFAAMYQLLMQHMPLLLEYTVNNRVTATIFWSAMVIGIGASTSILQVLITLGHVSGIVAVAILIALYVQYTTLLFLIFALSMIYRIALPKETFREDSRIVNSAYIFCLMLSLIGSIVSITPTSPYPFRSISVPLIGSIFRRILPLSTHENVMEIALRSNYIIIAYALLTNDIIFRKSLFAASCCVTNLMVPKIIRQLNYIYDRVLSASATYITLVTSYVSYYAGRKLSSVATAAYAVVVIILVLIPYRLRSVIFNAWNLFILPLILNLLLRNECTVGDQYLTRLSVLTLVSSAYLEIPQISLLVLAPLLRFDTTAYFKLKHKYKQITS